MPEFTPLQLQLRLRGPHDIDVAMKTTDRVDVTCPELHSRRPFAQKPSASSSSDPSSASSSSSSGGGGGNKKTNGTHATTNDASHQNGAVPNTANTNNNNNNNNNNTHATRPPPPKMTTPDAPPSLPPIAALATSPIKTQIAALDILFEPSTELHTLVLPTLRPRARADDEAAAGGRPPFASYGELIGHVGGQLAALARAATPEARRKLHGVLGSHPRLGAPKVDSAQSRAEQAQLNAGAADEAARLRDLNDEYERRFPGLRYVVFVNGRSRPVVMEDMRRRIDRGDPAEEENEAIRAMVDIARDRAKKLGAQL